MASRTAVLLLLCVGILMSGSRSLYGGDLDNWRCPYTPDGACAPKRQTYGYFAPKWKRWPGVTDNDYETKIKPGELSPPTGPMETGPTVTPDELLLPPDDYPDADTAPAPPRRSNGGPPPLTPDSEQPEATILSPPAEDAMEELLPDVDEPKRPADTDSVPDPAFDLEEPKSPTTQPELDTELNKPLDDDPFKDDPLFDDEAPAPPADSKEGRFQQVPEIESRPVPAMQTVPMRLPAAQMGGTPKSRLTHSSAPAKQRNGQPERALRGPQPLRARLSQLPISTNPLRAFPADEQIVADEQVLPTSAWESVAPVENKLETGWKSNPLRNQ